MKKKSKRWRWILLGVAILIVIIAIVLVNQSRNATSQYQEENVRNGTLETYYSFSGNVEVRDSQQINAKANSTVREIYVKEEQLVRKDDPLLRLSSGDIVKADIDGEVTDLHVSEGDTVSMGAPLVDIVDFTDLQVVFKVDEYDVASVTTGKDATVTIGALPLTYTDTVEYISKQAQSASTEMSGVSMSSVSSGNDVTYYTAKIPAPLDERILPGMNADVRILNERVDDVPLLSMNALQFDAYNKPFVYVRSSNGDVVSMSVGVGLQDGTTVQITDGLRSGDVVLVPQQNFTLFPMMGMR